ncbi:MAG TPA: hypothetical protein VGL81_36575 [Polyangiaceae bacterium]|jgi:hypothetical protein
MRYPALVAQVAGSSLLSFQRFLRETYGEGVYERALDALPAEDAAPMRGILLPIHWYATHPYIRALHAAHALTGDASFFEKFGVFAADYQITFFRKFILRFATPVFFLDRTARIWARTHDTGTWEVEGGTKRVRGTLRDFAVVDADYCRVLVAWVHRASQLTGTRGETVHLACRARGDAACVFEGWWT